VIGPLAGGIIAAALAAGAAYLLYATGMARLKATK